MLVVGSLTKNGHRGLRQSVRSLDTDGRILENNTSKYQKIHPTYFTLSGLFEPHDRFFEQRKPQAPICRRYARTCKAS